MKISITAYADSAYEAACIVEALKNVRSIEIGSYGDKPKVEQIFDKSFHQSSGEAQPSDNVGADNVQAPAARPNVSPGEPTIGKIGSTTKEDLLLIVQSGAQPKEKFTEHMKLLWKRGEVKYDGKDYYL